MRYLMGRYEISDRRACRVVPTHAVLDVLPRAARIR